MKLQHLIVISSLVMGSDVGDPESALAAGPLASAGSPIAQHKPIVIAIVVDQLASWVLRERIDKLPVDGGFARLRREGKYYQEMAYAHAITETAPGHASLFTGKLPREHGIIANDVLGPDGKKQATIADPSESNKLVSLDNSPVKGMGSSLAKLDTKADLVATAFRLRYPKGQGLIAAFSLKDRGTLFAAGEDADYAIWFDPKQRGMHDIAKEHGGFVTSKWFASSLQKSGLGAFVRGYLATGRKDDKRDGIERLEDLPWQGMDPTWLNENVGIPGASDYAGFIDAHTASQAPKPGAAFRALPDSDRLLLAMALQILKVESQELPVFLSVSLSANDYIGHLFGPDSWEAWDELRRLDGTLAWFFKELDQLGPRAWSVVLSADHGTVPPEDDVKRPKCGENPKSALDSGKPCSRSQAAGARIFAENLKSDAEMVAAQAALLGASGAKIDKVIAGVVYPYIYLTESAKAATRGDPAARARLAERLSSGLQKKYKGVHAVLDVTPFRMAPTCPDERASILAALVCHSISPDPERGGDFYVVLKPGAFFDPDLAKGAGISHGSPYGYDRFVPMLVRDPRRSDLAGQVEQKRVPFTLFRDELVRMVANANAQEK
jgi:predicted AlkP superfamily pyrophosphatase or phosphodiesterase